MNKVGISKDIHNKIKGNYIYLGGLRFDSNFCIEAYSDGDVILHSVCEALLGSIGKEDLGTYFSSKNQENNFSSQLIVDFVKKEISEKGAKINNIDIMLVIDNFLLMNNKEKIKENISRLFEINLENISLKATTSEGNFLNLVECLSIVSIEV